MIARVLPSHHLFSYIVEIFPLIIPETKMAGAWPDIMKTTPRDLHPLLISRLNPGRAIAIIGPKGVGKTHLLKQIKEQYDKNCLYLNAGKEKERMKLQNGRMATNGVLPSFVIIDEAYHLYPFRDTLEQLMRQSPYTRFLLSFESESQCNHDEDPFAMYNLYPLTEQEYRQFYETPAKMDLLSERLIYGNYPRLLHLKTKKEKQQYLSGIINHYLQEGLLHKDKQTKPGKDMQLLRMLSFLVGQEIFYRELEQKISLSRKSIAFFIQKLTQMNLIFQLQGYKKNLKKEVGKHAALYFMDNGIRNAIINNFNPIRIRNDLDKLWKNYLISERIKQQHYKNLKVNNFFWRTYDQQELDWVEECQGQLTGYYFSLDNNHSRPPSAWRRAYPHAGFRVISPDNYREWIVR